MMRWEKNLVNIVTTGHPGACPVCGSEDTDYVCKAVNHEDKKGYMIVWCNSCRRAFHVSRMEITDGLNTEGEIPKDLIY